MLKPKDGILSESLFTMGILIQQQAIAQNFDLVPSVFGRMRPVGPTLNVVGDDGQARCRRGAVAVVNVVSGWRFALRLDAVGRSRMGRQSQQSVQFGGTEGTKSHV